MMLDDLDTPEVVRVCAVVMVTVADIDYALLSPLLLAVNDTDYALTLIN